MGVRLRNRIRGFVLPEVRNEDVFVLTLIRRALRMTKDEWTDEGFDYWRGDVGFRRPKD